MWVYGEDVRVWLDWVGGGVGDGVYLSREGEFLGGVGGPEES